MRISPNEVAVASLEDFKTIHRLTSGFNKAQWYKDLVGSNKPGMFAETDPKVHATYRRLFAQAFSNSSTMTYEPIIRGKVTLAVDKIKRDASTGMADVYKWFTFLATDITGQLAFGKSFEMLEKEEKDQYILDLETIMMIGGVRLELGDVAFNTLAKLRVPPFRDAQATVSRMLQYAQNAIQELCERVQETEGTGIRTPTLFSRDLDPKKNKDVDFEQIRVQAVDLIIAGSDTTASTLTYLVWNVLKPEHARVKQALLDEIKNVTGDAPASTILALPVLRSVLNETLRLHGAISSSLPRVVPAGGTTLSGYPIPEKTIVSTQSWTIHRDPTIYTDPEKFDPGRWEKPTRAMKDAFHPWGAGSRMCIGIHIATLTMLLAAFTFFRECGDAVLSDSVTKESMEVVDYFVNSPKEKRLELRIARKEE